MNEIESPFARILIRTPEQRIISLLAMNPGKPFYLREISKTLGMSLGATHAALQTLERTKMLSTEFVGKTKLYELAVSSPVAQAFRVLNTILVLEPLVGELKVLARRIILYGSYASGTFSKKSDLDLLIVAEDKKRVLGFVEIAKRKTGLDLRPLVMNQLEWMSIEQKSPEFFDELSHGFVLWEKQVEESRL